MQAKSKSKLTINPPESKQTTKEVNKDDNSKSLSLAINAPSSKNNGQSPIKKQEKDELNQRNLSKNMTVKIKPTNDLMSALEKTTQIKDQEIENSTIHNDDSLKYITEKTFLENKSSCNHSDIQDADEKPQITPDILQLNEASKEKMDVHKPISFNECMLSISQSESFSFKNQVVVMAVSHILKVKSRNVQKQFLMKRPVVSISAEKESPDKDNKKGVSVFSNSCIFNLGKQNDKSIHLNKSVERFKVFFDQNFGSDHHNSKYSKASIFSKNYECSVRTPQLEYLVSLKKSQYRRAENGFAKLINPINIIDNGFKQDKVNDLIDIHQKNYEEKKKIIAEMKGNVVTSSISSIANFKRKAMNFQKQLS